MSECGLIFNFVSMFVNLLILLHLNMYVPGKKRSFSTLEMPNIFLDK